jgi:hypothetical protein
MAVGHLLIYIVVERHRTRCSPWTVALCDSGGGKITPSGTLTALVKVAVH